MVYANPKEIRVGKRYNYQFDKNSTTVMQTHECRHTIEITCIRSGIVFYILTKYPNLPESAFSINSFMAEHLEDINEE